MGLGDIGPDWERLKEHPGDKQMLKETYPREMSQSADGLGQGCA